MDPQNPKKARCDIAHLFPSVPIARWEAETREPAEATVMAASTGIDKRPRLKWTPEVVL